MNQKFTVKTIHENYGDIKAGTECIILKSCVDHYQVRHRGKIICVPHNMFRTRFQHEELAEQYQTRRRLTRREKKRAQFNRSEQS